MLRVLSDHPISCNILIRQRGKDESRRFELSECVCQRDNVQRSFHPIFHGRLTVYGTENVGFSNSEAHAKQVGSFVEFRQASLFFENACFSVLQRVSRDESVDGTRLVRCRNTSCCFSKTRLSEQAVSACVYFGLIQSHRSPFGALIALLTLVSWYFGSGSTLSPSCQDPYVHCECSSRALTSMNAQKRTNI